MASTQPGRGCTGIQGPRKGWSPAPSWAVPSSVGGVDPGTSLCPWGPRLTRWSHLVALARRLLAAMTHAGLWLCSFLGCAWSAAAVPTEQRALLVRVQCSCLHGMATPMPCQWLHTGGWSSGCPLRALGTSSGMATTESQGRWRPYYLELSPVLSSGVGSWCAAPRGRCLAPSRSLVASGHPGRVCCRFCSGTIPVPSHRQRWADMHCVLGAHSPLGPCSLSPDSGSLAPNLPLLPEQRVALSGKVLRAVGRGVTLRPKCHSKS